MSEAMRSIGKTGLLSPQERLRVRPAVFEDFLRTPAIEPTPPHEASSAEPSPVPSPPVLPPPTAESLSFTDQEVWEENPAWEQNIQEAYNRGFEDGKTAAAALYEAEFRRYNRWFQQLDTVIRNLRTHMQQLQQEVEQAAVRLAFVLAEHILGYQLRQDSTALEQLIQQALQAIPSGSGHLRIHLHPETLEILRRAGSTLVSAPEEGITLISDPSVEPMGCLIESPWGIVDAQLHQQLQSIREQLQC